MILLAVEHEITNNKIALKMVLKNRNLLRNLKNPIRLHANNYFHKYSN